MLQGVIGFWNEAKGYGFVTSGIRQYFLHWSNVPKGYRPVVNYRVTFEVGPGKDGKREQAVNVRFADMTPQTPAAVVAGVEAALKNAGGTGVSS